MYALLLHTLPFYSEEEKTHFYKAIKCFPFTDTSFVHQKRVGFHDYWILGNGLQVPISGVKIWTSALFPSVHSCHAILILSVMDPSGWVEAGPFKGNVRRKRGVLHFKRFFSPPLFSTDERQWEWPQIFWWIHNHSASPGPQHTHSPETLGYPVSAFIQHILSAYRMPSSQVLKTKHVILFPCHGVCNLGCVFRVIHKMSPCSFVSALALPSAWNAFPSDIHTACSTFPELFCSLQSSWRTSGAPSILALFPLLFPRWWSVCARVQALLE